MKDEFTSISLAKGIDLAKPIDYLIRNIFFSYLACSQNIPSLRKMELSFAI
jgi:hypothetical protein